MSYVLINVGKTFYLYGRAHNVPYSHESESDELRVWIVAYYCGAGQGYYWLPSESLCL